MGFWVSGYRNGKIRPLHTILIPEFPVADTRCVEAGKPTIVFKFSKPCSWGVRRYFEGKRRGTPPPRHQINHSVGPSLYENSSDHGATVESIYEHYVPLCPDFLKKKRLFKLNLIWLNFPRYCLFIWNCMQTVFQRARSTFCLLSLSLAFSACNFLQPWVRGERRVICHLMNGSESFCTDAMYNCVTHSYKTSQRKTDPISWWNHLVPFWGISFISWTNNPLYNYNPSIFRFTCKCLPDKPLNLRALSCQMLFSVVHSSPMVIPILQIVFIPAFRVKVGHS